MGRAEAPRATFPDPRPTFPEPLAIAEARARMPSIQFVPGPRANSLAEPPPTALYLPGVSRDHRFYDGPEIVGALAERMNVVAVGYPYQEQRPENIKDERPQTKEAITGALARAAEAVELLNRLQSGEGTLHIVAKSGGSKFTLAYLREHPEISKRVRLTILGLPPNNDDNVMAFDMPLQGLTVIQGELDQHLSPENAQNHLSGFREKLGFDPVLLRVKGDHSFRGENQDKNNFDVLPEHLPEVLEILKNLELERHRE